MLAYVNYEFASKRHRSILYRRELCWHMLIKGLLVNEMELYCIEVNYIGICLL